MTEPASSSSSPSTSAPADALHQPPPFWQRWSQLYWFVGGLLATNVLLFWLLTRWAT
jgi:hypothetical protein